MRPWWVEAVSAFLEEGAIPGNVSETTSSWYFPRWELVSMPLMKETTHLLGKEEFDILSSQKKAFVSTVSRGQTIGQEALLGWCPFLYIGWFAIWFVPAEKKMNKV
jgi:hypothetical protein